MAPAPTGFSFSSAPAAAGSPFTFSSTKQPTQSSSGPSTFSFGSSNTDSPRAEAGRSAIAQASHSNGDSVQADGLAPSHGDQVNDEDVEVCYLQPAAYSREEKKKWKASGRTIGAAVSPVGGEVASWVMKKASGNQNEAPTLATSEMDLSDRTIFFSSLNSLPDPIIQLYTESHLLFTSLQQIVAESYSRRLPSLSNERMVGAWDKRGNLIGGAGLLGPPDAETVMHMRRLADLYLDQLGELRAGVDVELELKAQFTTSYNILNLAEVLYLPVDGKGEGLVGEELLDWVNDVDPAPDNSQGNEIMSTKNPWDHPSFWPYISRCILRGFHLPAASFLRSLSSHAYAPISKLAALLAQHLSIFPRSSDQRWRVDLEFLQAHKVWLAKFRAELANFTGGRPRGKWFEDPELASWESDFRTVVELMEGKPSRVLEEVADWREALGAWGVLVDVDMRRDHLPEVMSIIVDKIPVDSTLPEDVIQSALCSADIIKALMGSYDLDIWLAAHLGDLLDKLELIPDDEQRFEIPLRDYFLLEYTEVLQNNPKHAAFWRVVCDYLNSAGQEGRNRLGSHIMHIAINLERGSKGKSKESMIAADDGMDVEGAVLREGKEIEEAVRLLDDVRAACGEYRLDEEFKTISQILAGRLIRKGEYGMAASMSMMAGDGWALSRIAENILEAYIIDGDAELLRLVDTLPPTLLAEAPTALAELQQIVPDPYASTDIPSSSALSIFASRLTFLSEFRDYLLFLAQGARDRAAAKLVGLLTSGIAPVGFWAVLLVESVTLLEDSEILFTSNETFELMRILEEVKSNASFAPADYLSQLIQYLDRSQAAKSQQQQQQVKSTTSKVTTTTEDAWKKIDEVRLALARNLARALVIGFDNPF
ncbi:nuclear pore complex protein Nup85 [Kwoniella heveanensis CBS 569]|nr:nuclear pore complex protein Nup85 [Kwoniella heveanensis CBS 569]